MKEPIGWISELIQKIIPLNWPGETRESMEKALSECDKISYPMRDVILRKMTDYAEYKTMVGQTWHGMASWLKQEEYLKDFKDMILKEKNKVKPGFQVQSPQRKKNIILTDNG
jgi:hypothetical protein